MRQSCARPSASALPCHPVGRRLIPVRLSTTYSVAPCAGCTGRLSDNACLTHLLIQPLTVPQPGQNGALFVTQRTCVGLCELEILRYVLATGRRNHNRLCPCLTSSGFFDRIISRAFGPFALSGPDHGAATWREDTIASSNGDGQVGRTIVSPAGSSLRTVGQS
jgi:hypothetical protein